MHARERDSCGEISDEREDGEVSLSSRASSSHAISIAPLICALNYSCTYFVSYNSVFTAIYSLMHTLFDEPRTEARAKVERQGVGWLGFVNALLAVCAIYDLVFNFRARPDRH